MALVLGLDLSIRKTGFCVLDTQKPFDHVVESGRLYTSSEDGILVQRLMKQAEQIRGVILKYGIKGIMKEEAVLDIATSEQLFALHQFVHKVFLEEKIPTVFTMPPSRLKWLACPDGSRSGEIGKPQMIIAARKQLKLDYNLADDAADAFWLAHFLKQYYQVAHDGIPQASLRPDVIKAFFGKHTFTRGPKAGTTIYEGMVYRINEFYYDFEHLNDRKGTYGGGKEEHKGGGESTSACSSKGSCKESPSKETSCSSEKQRGSSSGRLSSNTSKERNPRRSR